MSFSLTFFICQCVCLSPHLPLPSLQPISTSFSVKAVITRSATTLAARLIKLGPTNLISGFTSGDSILIIKHILCCSFIPVWGGGPGWGLCVHTQIRVSMFDRVWTSACVCKSSRVSLIAPGGRYWSDLRPQWDKVLEEGEAARRRRWRGDNPQACYQQGRVMGGVWRCLRHLEPEPWGPHSAAAGVSECRHPLQWRRRAFTPCMCVQTTGTWQKFEELLYQPQTQYWCVSVCIIEHAGVSEILKTVIWILSQRVKFNLLQLDHWIYLLWIYLVWGALILIIGGDKDSRSTQWLGG